MEQLAQFLRGQLHGPVEDRTGIQGKFDFSVEYASNDSTADAPALSTALSEAVGLKLNATKGPVEFLVVDRAGKPSAN
jgi:uncharacterized protein (TIGR03435 family)